MERIADLLAGKYPGTDLTAPPMNQLAESSLTESPLSQASLAQAPLSQSPLSQSAGVSRSVTAQTVLAPLTTAPATISFTTPSYVHRGETQTKDRGAADDPLESYAVENSTGDDSRGDKSSGDNMHPQNNVLAQSAPGGIEVEEDDLRELWDGVLTVLAQQMPPEVFSAWIRTLRLAALTLPSSFEGTAIAKVVAPNRFICDHTAEHYGAQIAATLKRLLSAAVEINFQVDPCRNPTRPHSGVSSRQQSADLSLNLSPSPSIHRSQDVSTPVSSPVSSSPSRPPVLGSKNGGNSGNIVSNSVAFDSAAFDSAAFDSTVGPSPAGQAAFANSAGLASSAGPRRHASETSRAVASRAVAPRTVAPRPAAPRTVAPRVVAYDETNLNPKYNFSNFVVGGCNQFAHAVGLRIAENLGSAYNPLFVYGGVGLGKTHLANAIGNATVRRHKKALLVSSETFVSELIASLRGNRMDQFKAKFRSLDLLIIDDIQFIIGKERTQEEFFHTFNELHNRHKQIVITSDKTPQELVGLEERLRTRFASGLSVDLQVPDFETRVAILSKKAELESAPLSEEVCRYIAEHIDTNVRELEGALNRLCAISSLHKTPINLTLAQEVVRSLMSSRKTKELTYEFIQQTVAEAYNVSLSDLLGKRRTQNIALARQVAMYLVRRLTGYSYPEIGAFFGGRDHSTVIHANKIISERLQSETDLRLLLTGLEKALKTA